MQELRTDELTGTSVIVVPGRATRPVVYTADAPASSAPARALDSCPFCPEHEAMTPPEVARFGTGAPDTPGWRVRVVPNKYPVVGEEPGIPGAHEVVVMSPAHDRQLDALSLDAATEVMIALRDRSAHHLRTGFVHAQALVNHGRASGASIEHPHAQLVALAFTPPHVDDVLARFVRAGRDLVTDAIDSAGGACLVHDTHAVSWCPPASTSPFFVRIALRSGPGRFDLSTSEEVRALTESLQDALARLHRVLGELAYNIVVNTAPRDDPRPFHCWIDIVPRLGVYGGFEMGTGVMVNPVAPETAASLLRDP
jgi:UDPglucose--hexose-1-phosphate uridylyltransferase